MGLLKTCAICCMCLSIWGFVQLLVMGIMFRMESVTFVEESEASDATSVDDFIKRTKDGYKGASFNCYIAGAMYGVSFAISLAVFLKSKRVATFPPGSEEEDERACSANLNSHNLDERLQRNLSIIQNKERARSKAKGEKMHSMRANEEQVMRQKIERQQEKQERQRRRQEASLKVDKE